MAKHSQEPSTSLKGSKKASLCVLDVASEKCGCSTGPAWMSDVADNNRTSTMRTMTDTKTNLSYEDIIHQLDEQIKYLLNLQDFTTPEARPALKFVQRQTRYNPDLFLNIRIVEKIVKLGIAHVFLRTWQSISKVDYFSAEQRVSFKNLQTILSIIWNCTDKSASLCDCLVRCDIIKLLLVELTSDRLINADLVNDANALYLIKSYLGILHNLVRLCRDGRHLFRISKAVTVLQSYFGATENLVKIKAYLILSYIINEDENSIINATDENIAFIIRILKDALEGENHFSKQYAFWASEIVCGLNHLAVNDLNKVRIGQLGALPLYMQLLQSEDKEEPALATAGVWILAFRDENKRLMKDERGFIDALQSLTGGCAHEGTRRAARGALWVISTVSQAPNKPQLESGAQSPAPAASGGDVPHVMLSYPWYYQRVMLRVRDQLRAAGYKVWMDVDNMSGSTLDAMALAVEHSALVVVCMSQQYKDSPSCRTEAEYSFRLRKDIIPLLLQPGYVPDGWLGLMVGTRLYFDFTTDESMTKEMPRLLREIGTRGKLAGAGSSCSDSFSSLNGLSSMLHNSLSTSSMHSYNRSQQVASWTPDDVQQWLTSCDLAMVADRLSDFTGELLLQYRKMLTDAPEYFYSSLEHHLHFDLITILVFTKALQGLS